jgi:hypothetical protein
LGPKATSNNKTKETGMRPSSLVIFRRVAFAALAFFSSADSVAQPLPSWNEGRPAKAGLQARD